MFGLIVAELAIKSADAIDSHHERPLGILTPALTFLVLTDVTSFWLWVWGARKVLEINWPTVFGGVLLAFVYFLAASLVFPRTTVVGRTSTPIIGLVSGWSRRACCLQMRS
jgi:hypothetical protein